MGNAFQVEGSVIEGLPNGTYSARNWPTAIG